MSNQIFLLIFINMCSAIGYSLLAPLYSSEAKKRDILEDTCGLVIAIYAAANFISTTFVPSLVSVFGRKNIFYIACIIEGSCTLTYGLLHFISNRNIFLFISFFSRFMHGIGASFSATLGILFLIPKFTLLQPICAVHRK
jgi:MFS family permease